MLNSVAGPTAWVESNVLPWIENPERNIEQLARWLRGDDFPPVGHEEEPYVWLLRALPRGAVRPSFESELARSAAELLKQASKIRNETDGVRLLYNLLGLCAGLRGRDHLAEPLLELFRNNVLRGLTYEANTLNSMLLPALICNQRDNTLQHVWEDVLRGTADPVLRGNPVDGFQGVLHMPPSETERGTPAVQAIGWALTELLSFVEGRPNRVTLLRSYIGQVQSRYPGYDWAREMIQFSHQYEWPQWTDVALPDLAIHDGVDQHITWCHVANVIAEQFQVETIGRWAGGRILRIRIPSGGSQMYRMVARTAEKYRRRTYWGGENAEKGILSSFCQELNLVFRAQNDSEAQQATERVLDINKEQVYAATTG